MTIVTPRLPAEAGPEAQGAGPMIVTAKHPRRRSVPDVPDMTPEEHKQRGDAADALFRVRQCRRGTGQGH